MPVRITTLAICLLLSPAALAAQGPAGVDTLAAASAARLEQLERKVEELERERLSQEEATRAIIRESIQSTGSKINNVAAFGGVFELAAGRVRPYSEITERFLQLSGLEVAFEVQADEWALGSLVLQYNEGGDVLVPTTEGTRVGVPRVDIDTGLLTLGDTQRFPFYVSLGRMVLPFGISTGDPVADVPTLEDPLTVEAFEMREDAVLLGFAFPTPAPLPPAAMIAPTPAKPRVFRPLFGKLARLLGYRPPPAPPAEPAYVVPTSPPPPVHVGVLVFHGETLDPKSLSGWRPKHHLGATAGFRAGTTRSIDVNASYTTSVFDSRFLRSEYGFFLDEIGLIPGASASVKARLGPLGLVTEWNGATRKAKLVDDLSTTRIFMPRAWQVGLVYQPGGGSSPEPPGSQGTYIAVGYSETRELTGVVTYPEGLEVRAGALPRERFLISVGEWVMDGVRVAIEYSQVKDYSPRDAGTGKTASGVQAVFTYDW